MQNSLGSRLVVAGLVAFLASTLYTRPVQAQLQPVVYGGGEWDTEDLQLYWAGAALQFARPGWSPWFGLYAYSMHLSQPGDDESTQGIVPAIGVRNQTTNSAFTVNIGYLFVSSDVNELEPNVLGGRGGVVTGFGLDYWGGAWLTRGDLSYNWNDQYFWSRVKGTYSLTGRPPASSVFRVGGEIIGQTGLRDDSYNAFQFGPMFEWQTSWGFLLGAAAGPKWDNRPFRDSGAIPYFKIELTWVPPT